VTLAVIEPSAGDWDDFVLHHPAGHLLQLSPWGQLKSAFGWQVCHVAVGETTRDGRGEPYHAKAPGTFRLPTTHSSLLAGAQVLFRTRYLVSVAYVPRGPLFSGRADVDDLLLAALKKRARQQRAVFLRLEPGILEQTSQADQVHSWLLRKGFQPTNPLQPRSTLQLALNQPVDTLFANFSKGHRADIRRASRKGVTMRVGNRQDIEAFYAIMQSTSKRAEFGIHTFDYYQKAWEFFGDRCRLLLAEQEKQTIASHIVFADAHNGLYLYSGANEQGLKSGANHLLQWEAIQWAKERSCTSYDFWGIPDAYGRAALLPAESQHHARLEAEARQDSLAHVYRFKKGFGGQIVRFLPAYDQIYLFPLYILWQRRLQ
jgi:lipid II:glycine glycyltransferase (peptidoglycan interpeptide bridge formation enzyme)